MPQQTNADAAFERLEECVQSLCQDAEMNVREFKRHAKCEDAIPDYSWRRTEYLVECARAAFTAYKSSLAGKMEEYPAGTVVFVPDDNGLWYRDNDGWFVPHGVVMGARQRYLRIDIAAPPPAPKVEKTCREEIDAIIVSEKWGEKQSVPRMMQSLADRLDAIERRLSGEGKV